MTAKRHGGRHGDDIGCGEPVFYACHVLLAIITVGIFIFVRVRLSCDLALIAVMPMVGGCYCRICTQCHSSQ